MLDKTSQRSVYCDRQSGCHSRFGDQTPQCWLAQFNGSQRTHSETSVEGCVVFRLLNQLCFWRTWVSRVSAVRPRTPAFGVLGSAIRNSTIVQFVLSNLVAAHLLRLMQHPSVRCAVIRNPVNRSRLNWEPGVSLAMETKRHSVCWRNSTVLN